MNIIIVNRMEHPPVSKGTGVKCMNSQIFLVYHQQGLQLKNFFKSVEFCKGSGEKKKSALIPRCFKDRFATTNVGELKLGDYTVELGCGTGNWSMLR